MKKTPRWFRLGAVLCLAALPAWLAAPGFGATQQKYQRTEADYVVPDVVLINQRGEQVRLPELLGSGGPVMVDFIYATCTTICPVLSAGFSHFQRKVAPEAGEIHLVSISIDPENDHPEVMEEYLNRYRAKPGWDFLTGSREDIDRVMRAFDAYVPDKMSHQPVLFLREPDAGPWIRIYGLIGGKDLMREYERLFGG